MGGKAEGGHWLQVDDWPGRVWVDPDGTRSYYIRRSMGGKRYEVNTGATTRSGAEAQLKIFEANPDAYRPGGGVADTIVLDTELARTFLAHSAKVDRNSKGWIRQQRTYLAWWMAILGGRDLRNVVLSRDVMPHLQDTPARGHKIRVIKRLYSWLRMDLHRITSREDPTLDLATPQSEPAQWTKTKVVPAKSLRAVLAVLKAPWLHALRVHLATGWHTTEVVRFAASGSVEPMPRGAKGAAGVLLLPTHKSGEPHRTRVSKAGLEAAKALLAHGPISREWYDRSVVKACAVARVEAWTPGMLRHTVATGAVQGGEDPKVVSSFLGHKSPRTTQRFYATTASPAKVRTPV